MSRNTPAANWTDFFRDARNVLSAFTVISLLAGITLITAPLVCRVLGWAQLSQEEASTLTLLYCISALSDALLGIYLNKAPDAVNLQTGAFATNEQTGTPGPTLKDDQEA
ncbi:hypothetical protein [Hymenobacter lapidiphilus]|uniref:Uncharacterized protein n=1 Tax=Hymenobacter lapidiphilus TaxID=2608003 RepID=A0A7Y7U530_9BACT|nr:hypothetical protein [Hymenobacter lapidiphilus]NVO30284.1 hypothetical protein [Hymenobacter lapidiphilus]